MIRSYTLRARAAAIVSATSWALLAGCPQDPEIPMDMGAPCETVADCPGNGARTCGKLAACVAGRCEAGRSLLIPCGDETPALRIDGGPVAGGGAGGDAGTPVDSGRLDASSGDAKLDACSSCGEAGPSDAAHSDAPVDGAS
ncbi:MAG: hypothetical protein MJD61_02035 [Proteobacteria bacterium]|nr:hypothetical protein [Pseudomonadota bacterium]